jgi:Ca2+-binding RTX toxin-like protein
MSGPGSLRTVRRGNDGDDEIENAGASVSGGDGDDVIGATSGEDARLYGGRGNDLLVGASGTDRLYGGTESDRLVGGPGDDFITGEDGDDILLDGNSLHSGHDTLVGGSGDDDLRAVEDYNAVPDVLDGGT